MKNKLHIFFLLILFIIPINVFAYSKEIIPGGIIGIKLFIEEAFIKKGIEMPEDIKRRLDFVIEAKKEADINTSLEVLRQHVFKDNKAEHPPIPFDYKLALMYRNKDQ